MELNPDDDMKQWLKNRTFVEDYRIHQDQQSQYPQKQREEVSSYTFDWIYPFFKPFHIHGFSATMTCVPHRRTLRRSHRHRLITIYTKTNRRNIARVSSSIEPTAFPATLPFRRYDNVRRSDIRHRVVFVLRSYFSFTAESYIKTFLALVSHQCGIKAKLITAGYSLPILVYTYGMVRWVFKTSSRICLVITKYIRISLSTCMRFHLYTALQLGQEFQLRSACLWLMSRCLECYLFHV